MKKRWWELCALACVLGSLLSLGTGCGAGDKTCSVSGKVTYQGKLLKTGVVNFVGPDGLTGTAGIQTDGTYFCPTAPVGLNKIGVVSEKPPPPAQFYKREAGGAPPPPPPTIDWFPIDPKFADPGTSGKEMTLKPGTNTQDIVLE